MQVMIAEHGNNRFAKRAYLTQHIQRARTAVDQVAHQPQLVARWIEFQCFEQRLEFITAALNVAEGVGGHERGGLSASC
jgi:hypothetical protein